MVGRTSEQDQAGYVPWKEHLKERLEGRGEGQSP